MEKETEIISAQVAGKLARAVKAEAKESNKSLSAYVGQIVQDRHKYRDVLTAIIEAIDKGNLELSGTLHDELKRMVRDFYAAQGSLVKDIKGEVEQLKTVQSDQAKTLDSLTKKIDGIGIGIAQLLGMRG